MSAFAAQSRLGSRLDNVEACSAFTHVTACRFARSPEATLSTRGFGGFVTSTAAPIATGRSDPVAGRDSHPLDLSALARRTSRSVTNGEPVLFHGSGTARWIAPAASGTPCSERERPRSPGDREDEPEGSRDRVGHRLRGEQAGVRCVCRRQQLGQSLADPPLERSAVSSRNRFG
jgi:hypothetical protein